MLDAAERPISFSLSERYGAVDQWQRVLARAERSIARGRSVCLQVAPARIGMFFGLTASANLFMMHPSYRAIAHLPLGERVRRMRDPALRARILAETPVITARASQHPGAGDDRRFRPPCGKMYRMGRIPNYEPGPEPVAHGRGAAHGRSALEQAYEGAIDG